MELTEEEKIILNFLKPEGQMELAELKSNAGLSGKKWDKSMKALSKHDLIKVTVEGDSKSVHLKS